MSQIAYRSQTIARGHPATVRYLLGGLLAFGALNAFGGGYYGMAGAEDVRKEWLEGSPFDDYFIPSLVLFVVVGGSFLAAAVAVFAKLRIARTAASPRARSCLDGSSSRQPSSATSPGCNRQPQSAGFLSSSSPGSCRTTTKTT